MAEAPNFLLIVTDQHRADHLGCYGNRVLRTPHIDSIAARGVAFERCYATNPICMPNRAALMTGRVPSVNGVRHNGVPLPLESVTFAEVLRAAGYRTALIGKAHLQTQSRREVPDPYLFPRPAGGRAPPSTLATALPRRYDGPEYLMEREEQWEADALRGIALPYYGFESAELVCSHGDRAFGHYTRWAQQRCPDIARLRGPANALPAATIRAPQAWRTAVPEEAWSTRFVEERTIAAVESFAREGQARPFLLQCSFPDPHHPFTPPGRYWDLYRPDDVEVPVSLAHRDPEEPALLSRLRALHAGPEFRPGPFSAQVVGEPAARQAIALTYGLIAMVDAAIGRILQTLERCGLDADTVVIFTSDHGDFMGDHGLMFKQGFHYEGVIRVPLLWADPARSARREQGLASTLDIGTSILARAGLAPPIGVQGRDLFGTEAPAMLAIEEDELPIHMDPLGPQRLWTAIDGRWRLTVWHGQPGGELFDRFEDPHELRNRWSDPQAQPQKLRMMEQLLQERMRLGETLPLALRSA